MKCSTHQNADATAVCIHCGRALCPSCSIRSKSGRVVCSEICSAALFQTEQTLQDLRTRSVRSLKVTAGFSIIAGTVMGVFGAFEFYNGIQRLGFFLVPMAVVLIVAGIVAFSIARKKEAVG